MNGWARKHGDLGAAAGRIRAAAVSQAAAGRRFIGSVLGQLRPWHSLREHQWDDHVADLNRFVDSLRSKQNGFVPYVSPEFGGREARVLLLNLSPGKGTDPAQGGSGFLSLRNPDGAAERLGEGIVAAGLPADNCVAWKIYPWYMRGLSDKPATERRNHMAVGFPLLRDLFDLLPELRVVVAFGEDAKEGWDGFRRMYPTTAKRVRMLGNRSTADRAYITRSQAQIEQWRSELIDTLELAKKHAAGPKRG